MITTILCPIASNPFTTLYARVLAPPTVGGKYSAITKILVIVHPTKQELELTVKQTLNRVLSQSSFLKAFLRISTRKFLLKIHRLDSWNMSLSINISLFILYGCQLHNDHLIFSASRSRVRAQIVCYNLTGLGLFLVEINKLTPHRWSNQCLREFRSHFLQTTSIA